MSECVCVCVREGGGEEGKDCPCLSVSVCEREGVGYRGKVCPRLSVGVCVCVCVRGREREKWMGKRGKREEEREGWEERRDIIVCVPLLIIMCSCFLQGENAKTW